jgi:hypothetical protein
LDEVDEVQLVVGEIHEEFGHRGKTIVFNEVFLLGGELERIAFVLEGKQSVFIS